MSTRRTPKEIALQSAAGSAFLWGGAWLYCYKQGEAALLNTVYNLTGAYYSTLGFDVTGRGFFFFCLVMAILSGFGWHAAGMQIEANYRLVERDILPRETTSASQVRLDSDGNRIDH